MTVFDRTLYFASYTPPFPAAGASATQGGIPTLWGMDFFNADAAGIGNGRSAALVPARQRRRRRPAPARSRSQQNEDPTLFDATLKGAIIPGVTIRAAQSCATFDATAGRSRHSPALTSTKFDIFFGATNARSGGGTGTPQAAPPGDSAHAAAPAHHRYGRRMGARRRLGHVRFAVHTAHALLVALTVFCRRRTACSSCKRKDGAAEPRTSRPITSRRTRWSRARSARSVSPSPAPRTSRRGSRRRSTCRRRSPPRSSSTSSARA